MQKSNNNNIIIQLLISPRLRICRYLILLIFTFMISAGFIWHMLDEGLALTPFEQYGGLLFFTLVFSGGSFLNIYVLTPKLLLNNKWIAYFCSLMGVVLLIMAVIILTQTILSGKENFSGDIDYFPMAISFISSTFSFFLLFAGTTTLVLFKRWILDMQQVEELESTTLQLELKLLENQINPHFLFNMLNNANIMIKKDPDIAVHIIAKLEDMLRYQMDDSSREKVYLKEEILFLNDFLELEKTRRDYFSYSILKEGKTNNVQIPPLLFITFVENAIKHNQDSQKASYVHILFQVTEDQLIFICDNSIPQRPSNKQVGGIGLTNIKRRLNLLYKDNYSLKQTKTDTNYKVTLELKL